VTCDRRYHLSNRRHLWRPAAALLQATDIETHLVMGRSEKIALTQELDIKFNDVTAMASVARQSKK
jgi:hypothetical protein